MSQNTVTFAYYVLQHITFYLLSQNMLIYSSMVHTPLKITAITSLHCPIQGPKYCTLSDSGPQFRTSCNPQSNSGPHAVNAVQFRTPCSLECPTQGPMQSTVSKSGPHAVQRVKFRALCSPLNPTRGTKQSTLFDSRSHEVHSVQFRAALVPSSGTKATHTV
jgi:hypothetical protein